MSEFAITFTSESGARRRYRFEKRPVHEQWHRYEDELDQGEWRPIGHEIVENIDIELSPGVLTERVA